MLRLLPSPPHRLDQISLRELFPGREIPRRDLRVDLHAGVLGDEVGCAYRVEGEVKEGMKT